MRRLASRPAEVVARTGACSLPAGHASLRYRLMTFQRPAAPWRDTLGEALLDAIFTGNGTRDEWDGIVFLTVPAWIKEEPRQAAT